MITLHPVHQRGDQAVMFLWKLLKERKPQQNISHDGNPVWERHVDFVKARPYPYWYLVYAAGRPVGMIYLTAEGAIGLQIAEMHHRKGYGRQAVAELIKRHPRTRYLANVAPGNLPSHAFWQAYATARVIQHTYQIDNGELKNGNGPSET